MEIAKKYQKILRLTPFAQDDNIARLPALERSDCGQVVICAKIESELSDLSVDEQQQYLKDLGFATSGLERLIQKAYETFF